ncbi:SigE family RNA polymerase sigma factor [Streptomyces sp. NPDC092296]|uniref:SigE family RNA polymerase sigma factor n=1 Tax=Streptomyces sp. NPDC092296 TaxID=3366012 RepID=UPI003821B6AA
MKPVLDDDGDFAQFATTRWNRLLRIAYMLTGDFHDAEDLVQITLVKVCDHWRRLPKAEIDLYVRRALINNHRSRLRKRRVTQFLTSLVPEPAHHGHTETAEHRVALVQALDSLTVRQRAAVILRYWDDMSEQETAEILGCSPNTVKVHTRRALAALRAHPALAAYAPILTGEMP